MSITDILNPSDIAAALKECEAPDTFNYKKFFQTCGLVKKAPHEVKTLFQFVDNDRSGFVEEQEMLNFLQRFDPSARLLTTAEATEFMAAADRDRDGKIGADVPSNGSFLVPVAEAALRILIETMKIGPRP